MFILKTGKLLRFRNKTEPHFGERCCFTGHRDISDENQDELIQRLKENVLNLYQKGVNTFYAGGALGFDTLAAECVIEVRKTNRDIRLVIVVPCRDQAAKWSSADRERYNTILKLADDVIFLADRYYNGCMQARNRYMVNHSHFCICYLTKPSGGTYYTVSYAEEKELEIYNLGRHKP